MRYLGTQIHKDRMDNGSCQGLGEGRRGSQCLMGVAFLFCRLKSGLGWMVAMSPNNVNVLHAVEVYV